jgi:hypothetical protein
MSNLITEMAQRQIEVAIRRAILPVAFGIIALVLFLFALTALFVALFYWEEPLHGPLVGALIVAGVALVLAIVAVLVIMLRPRPKPAPPQSSSLPQVATLLAQSAPALASKRPLTTAFLLAAALGLMAFGSSQRK